MTKDYVANVEDMDDFRELIHPKKGSKVWVFKNTKALDDYWYWPMPDMTNSVNNYITENNNENTAVVMANDNG
jgi:hypothetical protein